MYITFVFRRERKKNFKLDVIALEQEKSFALKTSTQGEKQERERAVAYVHKALWAEKDIEQSLEDDKDAIGHDSSHDKDQDDEDKSQKMNDLEIQELDLTRDNPNVNENPNVNAQEHHPVVNHVNDDSNVENSE